MAYYDHVILIVVESGFVYTAALISGLILYTLNQTGTLMLFAITSQLTVSVFYELGSFSHFRCAGLISNALPVFSFLWQGIVPTVIIVYVALGKSTETTMRTSTHSHSHSRSEIRSIRQLQLSQEPRQPIVRNSVTIWDQDDMLLP